MKSRVLGVVCMCFLMLSCSEDAAVVTDLSSTNVPTDGVDGATDTQGESTVKLGVEQFYTITNDFQDHLGKGESVYVLLTSVDTEKKYIIPPTKYTSVELEYVIMEDAKVDGECVKVPAEAFPLVVSVCQSRECSFVRSLDVLLKNPAHYNIGGIGGYLVPHIYPVSPCSEDFVELMNNIGEYKEI